MKNNNDIKIAVIGAIILLFAIGYQFSTFDYMRERDVVYKHILDIYELDSGFEYNQISYKRIAVRDEIIGNYVIEWRIRVGDEMIKYFKTFRSERNRNWHGAYRTFNFVYEKDDVIFISVSNEDI